MDDYRLNQNELHTALTDMDTLISEIRGISGTNDAAILEWEKIIQNTASQTGNEIMRVAVVGPIKSGKSSFINFLLQGDYLKRGAGVVTSIVTRVRHGKSLRATLYFKSWEEIDSDISQAALFLPDVMDIDRSERVRIRNPEDRQRLKEALRLLDTEYLVTNGTRSINAALISSYVNGFDSVQPLIRENSAIQHYEGERFGEHHCFVGDDTLAVYLKDIELEIDAVRLEENLEIADCQGSDSPNPLHLAMIQDYLLLTHLIVYVISSRTGLRQADISFLSMLRNMGIADNILFVVNCDFSEHESLEGLHTLVDRIREEISLLRPDPDLFAFSSLFHLFREDAAGLTEKDRLRLSQWERETDLVAFSERETARFLFVFQETLDSQKFRLLLQNPIERVRTLAESIAHWIGMHQEMLHQDAGQTGTIIQKIDRHQNRILQLQSTVQNTLSGHLEKLKAELKADVDTYFDLSGSGPMSSLPQFIRGRQIELEGYRNRLQQDGFTKALFLVFQEFRRQIDEFVARSVNPDIIRFIRSREKRVLESLATVAEPFDGLLREAISEYHLSLQTIGLESSVTSIENMPLPDLECVKTTSGLKLPPAGITLRYSARIKSEAVLRMGAYTMLTWIRRLLKKPFRNREDDGLMALRDAVERMKSETERSMDGHFRDYRENIKFQYLFKLVDATASVLHQNIMERFRSYSADSSEITSFARNHQTDKTGILDALTRFGNTTDDIRNRMGRIRNRLTPESGGNEAP